MGSTGRDRLLRQLVAATTALALVASITYILGRALMPHFASTIDDITADITTTTPPFDPQKAIDDLFVPAAAVAIAGAVDAQLILNQVTRRATPTRGPDPSSNDIDIRYQGDGDATLQLIVTGITVGEPRTESMTVILTTSGQTFSAQSGDCTLLVHRFEYVTAPRSPPSPPGLAPTFAGELTCTIAELRSGAIVTFVAAFDR